MHDPEKSDSVIVATKRTNKAGAGAEPEPRPGDQGERGSAKARTGRRSRALVTQALCPVRLSRHAYEEGTFHRCSSHIKVAASDGVSNAP